MLWSTRVITHRLTGDARRKSDCMTFHRICKHNRITQHYMCRPQEARYYFHQIEELTHFDRASATAILLSGKSIEHPDYTWFASGDTLIPPISVPDRILTRAALRKYKQE